MTDPGTWARAGIGSSIGGSLLGAFGAFQQGSATSQMFKYQSGIAQLNQQIALQNRDYALASGESQALQSGMRSRFQMGRIIANQGASNIDVGSGSSQDVQRSQLEIGQLDQATIRNNAARVAYGYSAEAATAGAQAGAYSAAAKNTMAAVPINVASSLISGAGSVSSKWLQGYGAGINLG